jgi:serine/threonine-protein phosphatase PP1 catalytic subunit
MVDKKVSKELMDCITSDDVDQLIAKLRDSYSKDNPKLVDIKESEIHKICNSVINIFRDEPSMVDITSPAYIVGDIHGQFQDLIRVFNCCGFPDTAKYIFLGDYVDRGKQSLETICLLYLYKIKYPTNIYILRGNHECSSINKIYGFYDECKKRVSIKAWKMFCDTFLFIPFCALLEEKIFCCHGGLGPDFLIIDQARNLKKPSDIPDEGIVCDLCWADPSDNIVGDFGFNERGVSVTFSAEYVKKFIEKNNLDLICRAHQVMEEGYEFFADQYLVTVFTAPNYTGEFDNNGSVMYVDENLMCSFHVLKSKANKMKELEKKKKGRKN